MAKIKNMVIGYINGKRTDIYTIGYMSGTVRSYNLRLINGMKKEHIKFMENANVKPIYDTETGEHIMDIYE